MIGDALSLSTKEVYTKVWLDVFLFMVNQLGMQPVLPIDPEFMVMFAIYKHDAGSCAQTIKQKFSAVSYMHGLHRLPDPCKDDRVLKILKTLSKTDVPNDPKSPITMGLLECILEVIDTVLPVAYDAHLFRAIISVMYHACLRVGECVLSNEKSDHALR